jgi:hypothetical protein
VWIGDVPNVMTSIDVPMPARERLARRSLCWLHSVSLLMQQGRRQSRAESHVNGVESRRWKQRQAMGQRLLDQPTAGWSRPQIRGARFWQLLRWAGAGFSLAWWLAKS